MTSHSYNSLFYYQVYLPLLFDSLDLDLFTKIQVLWLLPLALSLQQAYLSFSFLFVFVIVLFLSVIVLTTIWSIYSWSCHFWLSWIEWSYSFLCSSLLSMLLFPFFFPLILFIVSFSWIDWFNTMEWTSSSLFFMSFFLHFDWIIKVFGCSHLFTFLSHKSNCISFIHNRYS